MFVLNLLYHFAALFTVFHIVSQSFLLIHDCFLFYFILFMYFPSFFLPLLLGSLCTLYFILLPAYFCSILFCSLPTYALKTARTLFPQLFQPFLFLIHCCCYYYSLWGILADVIIFLRKNMIFSAFSISSTLCKIVVLICHSLLLVCAILVGLTLINIDKFQYVDMNLLTLSNLSFKLIYFLEQVIYP